MKTIMLGLLLMGFAGSALAVDPAALDARIHRLTDMFNALQAKPDKCIPPEILRNAKGIVLLDRTKAGFLFAFQGGVGVALVRDPVTQKWSPPAFVTANEASLGFQVGGERAFYAVVIMNTNGTHALAVPAPEIGSEARGTIGDASGGAQSKVSAVEHNSLVFCDRTGFFGGADVKAGGMSPEDDANIAYYAKPVQMADILFNHKVTATPAGMELIQSLADHAKVAQASPPRGK